MRNISVFVVVMLGACGLGELSIAPLPVEHRQMQERLEETLQALQVVEHRASGQAGPPWPTPRICELTQNGGEELEQDELLQFFPPAAQDSIVRRWTFVQTEMKGWTEEAPDEPEPIATDPNQGATVNATLSDIQDENAAILAGLADAEQEVQPETLLCMSELAYRATPAAAYNMAEQYSGEALACLVQCLRKANAAAAQICLTAPERFVNSAEDTEPVLVQYLQSSCPAPASEALCLF